MFSYPLTAISIVLSTLYPPQDHQVFEKYCDILIRNRINHEGREFHLRGLGLRKARKFGITKKVYLATLHSEREYNDIDDVMNSDSSKILNLHFLRNVKKKDLKDSWEWKEGLELQGFHDVGDIVERVIISNVSKGQIKTIHISDDQITFFLDGQPLYQSYDREFIDAVKGVYFLYPPNEELSAGLLGYSNLDC